MEFGDRTVGFSMLLFSVSIFAYYTFWVIILPFVDEDHFIHNYFLPHQYAIVLPTFGLVTLVCFLVVFIGVVMLKRRSQKAHTH